MQRKKGSGMWNKLWDDVLNRSLREEFFFDAIDYWGNRLLDELERIPAGTEIKAEVDCLGWIRLRRAWIVTLKWHEIDHWIMRHFPRAKELPCRWRFTEILKAAHRQNLMTMEG